MHLRRILVLFICLVVAESCDMETHYKQFNKCCKMCEPGTKMIIQASSCDDPVCQECLEGEYQDVYTIASKCKLQPFCDPNLNLQAQAQSRTKFTPCVCKTDHHCASADCDSCVMNTVCKAGEQLIKAATQTEDTVCERCSNGTFSNHKPGSTCTPWKECPSGYKEVVPGSSTSDRICELQNGYNVVVISLVVFLLILLVFGILGFGFYRYKKGTTGSISFVQKLRTCRFWGNRNAHQPVEDNIRIDIEPPQPTNQPQEDTEDLLKLEYPGVSENGMPVIQDHSKSLLLSEPETEPESLSERF